MRGWRRWLVAAAVAQGICVPPAVEATTGYSVRSDGDDQLYQIVLETGVATPVGPTGFADIEGLAFAPDGTLFGVDDSTDQLVRIDLASGAATVVGLLGVAPIDLGLAFDTTGALWMSTDAPAVLYRLDPASGAATAVGPQGRPVTGLAATCSGLIGLGGDNSDDLVLIDRLTGVATPVGPLTDTTSFADAGLDVDASGTVWGISDAFGAGEIFTVDLQSGAATIAASVTVAGVSATGFEGLAIASPPVAAAGPPQAISSGGTTAPLGAVPVAASGMWSIVGGGSGTFEPGAEVPGARFRHTGGAGPLVLRWTVTAGTCSVSADVTITVLNHPPTVSSVTVAPRPALIGTEVTFSLHATDVDGEPLSVGWNLGDGSTASGATVTHIYRASGIYSVNVLATDLTGASATETVMVPVHEPLSVTRALLRIAFDAPGQDTALVTGTLPLPAGFDPTDATLTVDLGGLIRDFVLDARGRGRSGTDRLRLRVRRGRDRGLAHEAAFVVKLRKNLAPAFTDEGLTDATVAKPGETRTVSIVVGMDHATFWALHDLRWTAKEGRRGVGISPRRREGARRSRQPVEAPARHGTALGSRGRRAPSGPALSLTPSMPPR